jgi:transcriptional regulator with GAF, ATPase, and Fis domain
VFASVSLVHKGNKVETPAFSDARAMRADQLQYELQDGPCLSAIREQETFLIPDLATDVRCERWSRQVVHETGLRSCLAFQLFVDEGSLGALNLYSFEADGFDSNSREEGWVFAAQAAVALQGAQTEQTLRSAMATRNIVGQAMGILMERYKITSARAFEILRQVSQSSNIKLHDVASSLARTGQIPEG